MRWRSWACSRCRPQVRRSIRTLHQAIQMVDTNEMEDNHVIDELQRGYKLKERLLRPAMVRVAHNPKSRSAF